MKLAPKNESQLVTAISHLLTYMQRQGKLAYIRNNTGAIKTQNRFIRFGAKGSSDIILFMPKGKTIFLEAKMPKGRQNDNQKAFQAMVEKLGFEYKIIRYIDELEEII